MLTVWRALGRSPALWKIATRLVPERVDEVQDPGKLARRSAAAVAQLAGRAWRGPLPAVPRSTRPLRRRRLEGLLPHLRRARDGRRLRELPRPERPGDLECRRSWAALPGAGRAPARRPPGLDAYVRSPARAEHDAPRDRRHRASRVTHVRGEGERRSGPAPTPGPRGASRPTLPSRRTSRRCCSGRAPGSAPRTEGREHRPGFGVAFARWRPGAASTRRPARPIRAALPDRVGRHGHVWLARLRGKRGFEKLFAVKTIRTELVDDPRFQEMLLDEARIASGIQHPNVAQILDLGEQDDVLYIVMEWVDGESLAKIRQARSEARRRPPDRHRFAGARRRVRRPACGPRATRRRGRAARDRSSRRVAPEHPRQRRGRSQSDRFRHCQGPKPQQGETRTGVVKGKVQYMAPEQVKKGRGVDRRADVWALGGACTSSSPAACPTTETTSRGDPKAHDRRAAPRAEGSPSADASACWNASLGARIRLPVSQPLPACSGRWRRR